MKYLVFDTETTDLLANGLMPMEKQPHIIEFYGALISEDGTILQELDTLINPGIKISELVTKITTITNDMVRDAPRFGNIVQKIIAMMQQADVIVAHNLAFDWAVVAIELKRLGFDIANAAKPNARKLCTVEATEYMKGFRLSLTALHTELFGEGFADAHRAKSDATALIKCLVEMIKRGII